MPIKDRTGGGDSYTSGVLAALLKEKDLQTAVEAEVKRALGGGGVKASR